MAIVVSGCLAAIMISNLVLHRASATPPCPCTVFSASDPASQPTLYDNGGAGIELGFKFTVNYDGYVSGIRFYKIAGMVGTHTASLWDSMGHRLTQAVFTSETAAGWQQVNFTPIPVVASTLYTASVFMGSGEYTATSQYFTTSMTNSPFVVPKSGSAGDGLGNTGQGVYDGSGVSAYPFASYGAANYWVDAMYINSTSATPPSVTSQTPSPDATNVAVADTVTATFDQQLTPASVNTSTFLAQDAQGVSVPGTVSYDAATRTAQFVVDSLWQTGGRYTVTLKGGPGGIQDMDGRFMAADVSWSFTASSTPLGCPCSLENRQAPSDYSATYQETSPNGLELGMKIVPRTNGYITAIRFYKPIINPDTAHVGHIWDASGTLLATATITNESDYGWQEGKLDTPLRVTRDQLYIVSYNTPSKYYVATVGGLDAPMITPGIAAYPTGDSRNAAAGSGLMNSVYSLTANTYPSVGATGNRVYYIDAVFASQPTDIAPLHVVAPQPSNGSYGVSRTANVSASFDQALNPATVNAATVQVRDAEGLSVAGAVSYDSSKHAILFTPSSAFTYNTKYAVTLDTGITTVDGIPLAANYSWSFTIGSPLNPSMATGEGGPILVITTNGDRYGQYYAEILRTEGLNYFSVADISIVTPALLQGYKAVILGQMSLSQAQVDMLSSWVNGGGSLVAMRPDSKLAGLLGLTAVGTTHTNDYLQVNNATTPGMGIVNDTIQFKGTADDYTASGATVVARLYSDASTATSYPAVTTKAVGSGTAMSFSYDLARSVIGLHQGNQAWSGQDRNGDNVIRSDDLFFGPSQGDMQPDWLDSNKMAIPQADEQQRLLANLITDSLTNQLPAPRFWYLPGDQKAALVMAGDDHNLPNNVGTEFAFNNWLNDSPTDCSVMDWQCVRASGYVYVGSALTDARASQYISYGFDVGDHPSHNEGCNLYASDAALNAEYANNLAQWRAKFTSVPLQKTVRYHCYLWSSWDVMSKADVANGIRYDLTTVAYPTAWIGTSSPMVTGSGMNMRLTDASGSLLDVRQGVTNFDNTTAPASSIATMLDNALGAPGYYGLFGSHYDMTGDAYDQTLYVAAKSRHIPIISAAQALTWLDGRESSNFTNVSNNQASHQVTFAIEAAEGSSGLRAMMPIKGDGGDLATIRGDGGDVAYQTSIMTGVQYAVFDAVPGNYIVTYSGQPRLTVGAGSGSDGSGVVIAPKIGGQSNAESNEATVAVDDRLSQPSSETRTSPEYHQPHFGAQGSTAQWWQTPIAVGVGSVIGLFAVGVVVRIVIVRRLR